MFNYYKYAQEQLNKPEPVMEEQPVVSEQTVAPQPQGIQPNNIQQLSTQSALQVADKFQAEITNLGLDVLSPDILGDIIGQVMSETRQKLGIQ